MINFTVSVNDTAALLAAQAYGAGALLRWESAPAATGPWAEGGTTPLVAGKSYYELFDQNGTEATFYRTRITTAAGTAPSPYSPIWQPLAAGPTLTLDELKAIIGATTATDEALQMALNAAATAVAQVAGPSVTVTEVHRYDAGYPTIILGSEAASLTSVTEDDILLASTDYEVGGYVLTRLVDGSIATWGHKVVVVYEPTDTTAERQRAQAALVKLDLTFSPGITSVSIGSWSESYLQGGMAYANERSAILATLGSGQGRMLVR